VLALTGESQTSSFARTLHHTALSAATRTVLYVDLILCLALTFCKVARTGTARCHVPKAANLNGRYFVFPHETVNLPHMESALPLDGQAVRKHKFVMNVVHVLLFPVLSSCNLL
jgi:hypothetical protein